MSIIKLTPSELSRTIPGLQVDIGKSLSIQKHIIPLTLDFSLSNLAVGEYYLPLPIDALIGKYLLRIEAAYEALGANTALSIGLANFVKPIAVNNNDQYEIDSTLVTIADTKFVPSFTTSTASTKLTNLLPFTNADYKFVNNDSIVIKNSGTAAITTGKLRLEIELYNI